MRQWVVPVRVSRRGRDARAGFTVELRARFESLAAGQVLLDSRSEDGRGIVLRTTGGGTAELALNDGRSECRWDCDPGMLRAGGEHHVAVIVDGGPKIISFVTDGKFNDGGEHRQFGWGRYSPHLRTPQGAAELRIGPAFDGEVKRLRIYGRALMVSEVIGNWRSGASSTSAME